MKQIHLTEYRRSEKAHRLSGLERDLIAKHISSITIEPASGMPGCYFLTPSSWVGVLEVEDLSIQIKPKILIKRLLFLMSYSLDPKNWLEMGFNSAEEDSLVEAIIPAFIRHLSRLFGRGILQGYRQRSDSLTTVRGQIRFSDQIRTRFGIMPPIEVTYDEFTEDVIENQLIKAAICKLLHNRIRSTKFRNDLLRFELALANVSLVQFDYRNLPTIKLSRLNNRYAHAIDLAKLILRSSSFDQTTGNLRSRSFLVNMNQVFEDFVVVALREALKLSPYSFPQNAHGRRLVLDNEARIRLEPDISWWRDGICCFVGDVKYKQLDKRARQADLYQLLAYVIAAKLPRGVLVYAKDEAEPSIRSDLHGIPLANKELHVVAVDLANGPEDVLLQIQEIGNLIKRHVSPADVPALIGG